MHHFLLVCQNLLCMIFKEHHYRLPSLNFFKSSGTGFNLATSNSANFSVSNLSSSDFKLAKSSFLANFDVSTHFVFFKSDFVA